MIELISRHRITDEFSDRTATPELLDCHPVAWLSDHALGEPAAVLAGQLVAEPNDLPLPVAGPPQGRHGRPAIHPCRDAQVPRALRQVLGDRQELGRELDRHQPPVQGFVGRGALPGSRARRASMTVERERLLVGPVGKPDIAWKTVRAHSPILGKLSQVIAVSGIRSNCESRGRRRRSVDDRP